MISYLTIWDGLFLTALFVIFCLVQSMYQARKFAHNQSINHFEHGAYYGMYCVLIACAYWHEFSLWTGIKVLVFGVVTRAAFFDIILNAIRKKPLWYNSPIGGKPGSLIDWWENDLLNVKGPNGMRNMLILKISYLAIWLIYLLLIL